MCYGFDGNAALDRSLAARGMGRRSFLRGALVAAAGVVTAGAGVAPAAAGLKATGRSQVPPGLISIQLYTVRAALGGSPGFDETLRRIAAMGYPQVELAGYYGRTATELRAFLDSIEVRATSSHDGISPDAQALETKIQNAVTMGQSFVVVPYLRSDNADDWKRWAEQMNQEAAAARAAGLRYGYHNHAHEFTIDLGGGLRPWDVLTTELDPALVHMEVDIHWAVTGGIENNESDPEQFAIDVIRDAPQRVLQYHVKDRNDDTGDTADLGTGIIDFARILRAHAVSQYIVENDTPDVSPLHTADVGYAYLRQLRF